MSHLPPSAASTVAACLAQSAAGLLRFPDVVGRLAAAGVDLYQADLLRDQITVYLSGGEILVVPLGAPAPDPGAAFEAAGVRAAIGAAQRDEVRYPEFLGRIRAAGVIGYFVFIAGRRVNYYGRTGDQHMEAFPPVV